MNIFLWILAIIGIWFVLAVFILPPLKISTEVFLSLVLIVIGIGLIGLLAYMLHKGEIKLEG